MGEIVTVDRRIVAITDALNGAEATFERLLPKFMLDQRERFMQLALESAKRPEIVQCEPASIVAVVMKAAQCGLPLDGTHSAMVPFRDKGVLKAQFIPMFQGLIVASMRNGGVKSVWSSVVYDGDVFREVRGTNPGLVHEPSIGNRSIDKAFGVYACAKLETGETVFEFMDKEQVLAIKKTSKAVASGPWSKADQEGEMWRKTAVRRLAKYLPKSPDLQAVLDADEEYEKFTPRDVEFEHVTPPAQHSNGGPKRDLADLVPKQQPKSQPSNGPSKQVEHVSDEPLPVRWYHSIEIHLSESAERWLDQQLNSKGPLNGLTYRDCASSTDKAVREAVKAVLDEGAALQEKNGGAATAYQKMAEACRVFDNATLHKGPLESVPADDENRV